MGFLRVSWQPAPAACAGQKTLGKWGGEGFFFRGWLNVIARPMSLIQQPCKAGPAKWEMVSLNVILQTDWDLDAKLLPHQIFAAPFQCLAGRQKPIGEAVEGLKKS